MAGVEPLTVAVLSCSDLGIEVANRLHREECVRKVFLVTAPSLRRPRSWRQKVRLVWRAEGIRGLAAVPFRKLRRRLVRTAPTAATIVLEPGIDLLHFADFEADDCRTAICKRAPDLGVIAGTYILSAKVFEIPRLGSINLHSGKAPEYRGAAPGFWELYNGEDHVGITIHRVVADVDAGAILRQETFPLDPAPAEDPVRYLERYRREVLRPNGVRLLIAAVGDIASGDVTEHVQESSRATTYRSPRYAAVRELRRRVADRRRIRRQ